LVDYTESFLDQIVGFNFAGGFSVLFDLGFLHGATDKGTTAVNVLGGSNEVVLVEFIDPPVPGFVPLSPVFPFPPLRVSVSKLFHQSDFTNQAGDMINPLIIPFEISGLPVHPVNGIPFLSGFINCFVFFGDPKITVLTDTALRDNPKMVGLAGVSWGEVVGNGIHIDALQPSTVISPTFKIAFGKKSATVTITP
jgi:hypothetical protein